MIHAHSCKMIVIAPSLLHGTIPAESQYDLSWGTRQRSQSSVLFSHLAFNGIPLLFMPLTQPFVHALTHYGAFKLDSLRFQQRSSNQRTKDPGGLLPPGARMSELAQEGKILESPLSKIGTGNTICKQSSLRGSIR